MNVRLASTLLAITVVFGLTSATQAENINFNFRAASGGAAMEMVETAGAPGVNDDNWNEIIADDSGNPFGIAAGSIFDGTGSTTPTAAMSLVLSGYLGDDGGYPGGGTANDARMFSSAFDIFGGGSSLTATFSNIPYATYDVYVYTYAANNERGGEVWANGFGTGTRESIRGLDVLSTTSYIEVDSSAPFSSTTTPQGSYVVFEGLSGDLTLDWDVEVRFPISGVQIVEVPEPTSITLLITGMIGVCALRRRKRCYVKA